ncbi:MAG: UDP-N-acetylmuramate dehydrogenase [Terriglobia bacterium]
MADHPLFASISILENQPLKPLTTFKIGGPARYFARVEHEVTPALEFAEMHALPVLILGGGSNVLISDAGLNAFVLHPCREKIELVDENSDCVTLRVEAGESWDHLVAYAVEHRWWGVENLSHIPGQAGAALVQNIGAYGQQLSDVLESAEVMEISTHTLKMLRRDECGLGYRRSIFNTSSKGRYLILSLTLRLSKLPRPNLDYADVKAWFARLGEATPSLKQIREAIITIRNGKFPYPFEEKGGNAGSFFKNLILEPQEFEQLERSVVHGFGREALNRLRAFRDRFHSSDGIRVPTAFLIDLCGLKGCHLGGAEVNGKQPLVLINRGGATARDVLLLARRVRQTIFQRLGLRIDIEPELVGFGPEELEEYLALEG